MPGLSSLKLDSETEFDKDQKPKINIVLKFLLEHNESYDFRQPVDWKGINKNNEGMNLTDYSTIVKHPMDLSTIEKKFKEGKYKFVEDFLDDVQLIWDNCKLFNMASSWIYEVAEKIERAFKKLVKNYFPDLHIVIPQSSSSLIEKLEEIIRMKKSTYESMGLYGEEDITYFEKLKFCERLEKLEENQLEKLINWIEEKCPEVLSEVATERIQILVDKFDQDCFHLAIEENEFNRDWIQILADCQLDVVNKRVKMR